MNRQELKDQINSFLSTIFKDKETKMERVTLEDGTEIEFDSLEVGQPIFVIVDDEKQPLPNGEYLIGDKLVIVIDGVIDNITDKSVEPVEEEKAETENKIVEASKEDSKEEDKKEVEDVKVEASKDLEITLKFSQEDFDKIKEDFNTKLTTEKERIKLELDKLTETVNNSTSKITQAPVETKTKSNEPLSTKEIMINYMHEQDKKEN